MTGRHVAPTTEYVEDPEEGSAVLRSRWPEFAPEHHEGAHVAPDAEEGER